MSVTVNDKNLGHATAYAYAKSKGYTGTEEEFAELMANFAEKAEEAKGYADDAKTYAQQASTSAGDAVTAKNTAVTKANEASQSATNASTSAGNASASANSASASAQTAITKASEAEQSATEASESASTAVSAKDDAVTAKESAETAKTDAETAKTEAEQAAEEATQTVANKADKDGTYPDMTVGSVFSDDSYAEDQTPYLYRVSGGGVEVGNIEADKIVGGTVAFNQLINYASSSTKTVNGVTFTYDGSGKVTVNGTATATADYNLNRVDYINGHKYMMLGIPQSTGCSAFLFSENFTHPTIKAPQKSDYFTARIRVANGATVSNAVFHLLLIDLTQMFGSNIADMIYNMEQSSTGAGVAFFRSLFPNDYYEYNAGELLSVEGVSAHVMRDADSNIIGNYPLDSSLTLRGIPKVADGKLYFDGDTYEADGTVTRKYGIRVFDGSETWNARSVQGSYVCQDKSFVALNAQTQTTNKNLISNTYPSETWGVSQSTDKVVSLYFYQGLHIHDKSFADVTALKDYLSQHPLTVVYELATPTTESAEPYESIQKVSKYGTEEYVSTGIVPVGHVTKYPTDIVGKVNGLPSDFSTLIAPTEKEFKATRAYSVNQFIIVNNQIYRVTASIANGATITVGTNVVATTIADILTSLLNA